MNIEKLKYAVISITGVLNILMVNLFNGYQSLFYFVVLLMVLDLVTRCYAASIRKDEKIEDEKFIFGLKKKLGLVLLIGLSIIIDAGINLVGNVFEEYLNIALPHITAAIPLVLAWLFIKESSSIINNLVHGGVNVPGFLVKMVTSAEESIDNVQEKRNNKD